MAAIVKYRPARFGAFGRTLAALSTLAGFRTAVGIPTSTTDNAIARYDSTAGALQNSAATVADTTGAITAGSFKSTASFTIADDAVQTFTLSSYYGGNTVYAYAIMVAEFGATAGGLFRIITAGTDFPSTVGGSINTTNTNFANTALTGTTGTDGKLTLSVASGIFYIENRLGSSQPFRLIFLLG